MALINCPECNNQVSSTAETCPHCGAPISGAKEGAAAGAPIKTIQETSKKLKIQILIASLLFWVGLIWFFIEANKVEQGGEQPAIPAVLMLIGMILYLVTRARIWWHHK